MFLISGRKEECCGCTACEHICPKHCITMVEDEEGFKHPIIDRINCINCHLCEKVCPVNTPSYINELNPTVYAAYIKSDEERKKSSSGGLFFVIAKWVIEQGGLVYGAAFDKNLRLAHIGVDNLNDLNLLRGSKYLQSDLSDTYLEIKENLLKGRLCYFVGTGCQVAGLKSFLRKEYDTLITSDLVCHGVPSQKMFDYHLEFLRKKHNNPNIIGYKFRDNASWGGCEIVDFANLDGTIKNYRKPTYELSPYLYSFMHSYNYRYSCYECKFAKIPRQGDITLADFWGVNTFFPDMDISKGVSLILVNNDKGKNVWNSIKENVVFRVSTVEDGAKFNKNLISETSKHPMRDKIYKLIDERGYDYVAKTIFRSPDYKKYVIAQYLSKVKFIYKPLKEVYKKIFCK